MLLKSLLVIAFSSIATPIHSWRLLPLRVNLSKFVVNLSFLMATSGLIAPDVYAEGGAFLGTYRDPAHPGYSRCSNFFPARFFYANNN